MLTMKMGDKANLSLALWERGSFLLGISPSPSGRDKAYLSLAHWRTPAYLSLSLWERLGEGLSQIVVHPPHPSSPSRERGCLLFDISPFPIFNTQFSIPNLQYSIFNTQSSIINNKSSIFNNKKMRICQSIPSFFI